MNQQTDPIEGGKGYVVNVEEGKVVTFTGTAWTNAPADSPAPKTRQAGKATPSGQAKEAWAFVVSGIIGKDAGGDRGIAPTGGDRDAAPTEFPSDSLIVQVKNLRTGEVMRDVVSTPLPPHAGVGGYFSVASADLSHKSIIQAGDKLEISFTTGQVEYGKIIREVEMDNIRKAFLSVRLPLSSLMPSRNALLQNYPNPFNAETWIPYQLARESRVAIKIFNVAGQLVKTLELGHREAGYYLRKEQTAHWDGRNNLGESVASGVYFYTINAGDFVATRRLAILK